MTERPHPGDLARKVSALPDTPGVYRFRDARGRVIYVGKAVSLRRRVASYFQKTHASERTARLAGDIADLDVVATGTEVEALILEQSLVRQEKPRWNVRLRDDKSPLYLRLTTSDPWPGLYLARRPAKDGDRYFGPFVPASSARRTLRLLAQNFRLRVCKGPAEGQNYRACLYYQIHQCLAPCVGLTTGEEYGGAVRDATLFLEGRDRELRGDLVAQMETASAEERFERAAQLRDLVRMLDSFWEKQRVASTGMEDQDVFGMHREGGRAVLHAFQVRRGLVSGRREFEWDDLLDLPDAELLRGALEQYYGTAGTVPAEILVPFEFEGLDLLGTWLTGRRGGRVSIHVPLRGAKRDRLALVTENARLGFDRRFRWTARPLEELKEALSLPRLPRRIECFDISNIQGTDVVASLVVFVDGKPRRSEYRKFRIRTVEALPDDFASMAEVVSRRYRRLTEAGEPLPDLILIDGGRGQLSAAARALDALGLSDAPLASLAKEEEILHVRGIPDPVALPRDSAALQLVQRVRDEAHRFAVTFHRARRSRRLLDSVLERVPGIGPARARALLRKFGSVRGVQRAGEDALAEVVGRKAAGELRKILETAAGGGGEGGGRGDSS